MKSILFAALCALLLGVASPALAQDCCQRCQQKCGCESCCHLVCEMIPVKKFSYSCECEDICLPGPSQRCPNCECHDCAKDCKGDEHCYKKWTWIPSTCAKLCQRKKLVKHEETVMQPTYKWVTESLCPKCAKNCVTHE